MPAQFLHRGLFRVEEDLLCTNLDADGLVGLHHVQECTAHDASHPDAVHTSCQVIVEAVHCIGIRIISHDAGHLQVRECPPDGDEDRVVLVQLQPVRLIECHDVVCTLGKVHVLHPSGITVGSHVHDPCPRRRVRSGCLALELVESPYLIPHDLILPWFPIWKADVIVLVILHFHVPDPDDEG